MRRKIPTVWSHCNSCRTSSWCCEGHSTTSMLPKSPGMRCTCVAVSVCTSKHTLHLSYCGLSIKTVTGARDTHPHTVLYSTTYVCMLSYTGGILRKVPNLLWDSVVGEMGADNRRSTGGETNQVSRPSSIASEPEPHKTSPSYPVSSRPKSALTFVTCLATGEFLHRSVSVDFSSLYRLLVWPVLGGNKRE